MTLNSFFSMKRRYYILTLALGLSVATMAQTVEHTPDNYYTSQDQGHPQPLPLPFIRESDVVWSTELWKTINTAELFNQFFYFPYDEYINFGKKSLAYILWDAMAADEIPVYEDDELLIPIDNQLFVERYTRADTLLLEIGYDDDDNELYETVIRPKYFDGSEVFNYSLREIWFIGRQDTRQDSRRMALAPIKDSYRELPNGEVIPLGNLALFWVPMQNPKVRSLLVRYKAYIDQNNMVGQPSWDWVFLNQHYEAYITRESNVYLRSVSDYVTGIDAILESQNIEDKVFAIENDMWEY